MKHTSFAYGRVIWLLLGLSPALVACSNNATLRSAKIEKSVQGSANSWTDSVNPGNGKNAQSQPPSDNAATLQEGEAEPGTPAVPASEAEISAAQDELAAQPQMSPEQVDTCDPNATKYRAGTIWRLTDEQYVKTVGELFGLTVGKRPFVDERVAKLGAQGVDALHISESGAKQVLEESLSLAAQWKSELLQQHSCLSEQSVSDACADELVQQVALKAFRHQVSLAELDHFRNFLKTARQKFNADQTTELFAAAVLASPSFLFRWELGGVPGSDGLAQLTSNEMASAISYGLADIPPDAELKASLAKVDISDAAQLVSVLEEYLKRVDLPRGLARFVNNLIEFDGTIGEKSSNHFSDFSADIRQRLAREQETLIAFLIADRRASLADLLQTDVVVVSEATQSYYNISGVSGNNLQLGTLDTSIRQGLLSHPALMAHYSTSVYPDPIHRGKLVRESFFCGQMPPPPPEATLVTLPAEDAGLSNRERHELHFSKPACSNCHQLMDNIGFAFERFDASGRYVESYLGQNISQAGELLATDVDGPLDGVGSLIPKIVGSTRAQKCVTSAAFQDLSGFETKPSDACSTQEVFRKNVMTTPLIEVMATVLASEGKLMRRSLASVQKGQ